MSQIIKVGGSRFEVISELPYVTIADSFVRPPNKLKSTTGNGEARLYVGQQNSNILEEFFGGMFDECFFAKNDYIKFLYDAKYEYEHQEQSYRKDISKLRNKHNEMVENEKGDLFKFSIKIQNGEKDQNRLYISSESEYYLMMRMIALPNISYLTILKVKDLSNGKIKFYFHLFLDYTYNSQNHPQLILNIEQKLQNRLLDKNTSKEDALEIQKIVKSRKGQGEYRERLLQDINSCIVTGVNDERILIASHIKPRAISEDHEKIDYLNGLILTPTYDKLFDQGFITFTSDCTMIISPYISPMNQKRLGLVNNQKFDFKVAGREKYLEYHNSNIFKG